ncbi:MAG: hypothetical protein NVS1B2_15940 [Vulcanimicrobiaceae bacterium]
MRVLLYCLDEKRWFMYYDPFGDPPGAMAYRTGRAYFTRFARWAKHFDSARDAHAFWMQVHPTDPTRPDGKPNRPLTAYTVEVVPRERAFRTTD